MTEMVFFLKGLAIGFSIAAPVGPIGILCIRRTLARGRVAGLVSGLGAATADATYGIIGGFGLTLISNFLIDRQIWLRLIGGVFLLYLGIRTFMARLPQEDKNSDETAGVSDYASTFFLTLTNPATILSFAAIFAGLGLGSANDGYVSASVLVFGVFLGSALWWLILSETVSVFREKIGQSMLGWVNRISGGIISLFGIAALLSLLNGR